MNALLDDTIVALSSAPGPGARAIVRLSGPAACAIVDRVFTAEPADARGRLVSGHLRLTGVRSPLPADRYLFAAPHSYTGQDCIELHTVSSPPLIELLIADLLMAGARSAQPGEFTLRAFLAGKKDLTRAEAVLAVIDAGTDADLKAALAQLAGGVARPLDTLRDDLLNLLADIEAGLDFVDEDIEFVGKSDQLLRIATGLAQLTNLKRQLDDRTVSDRPIRVVLAGPPNAGKSSLFNALSTAGPGAIVSPIAGTTRDYLTAVLDLAGIRVELVDTAGIRETTDGIDRASQALGQSQSERAEIVVWCVPSDEPDALRPPLHLFDTLTVYTKSDLAFREGELSTSTTTPHGLENLRAALTAKVQSLSRPALAPSQSRCRYHVDAAIDSLRRAHAHVLYDDPQELIALELRKALDQLGEMVGAIYTNDLLDRIFSRFCIGK